MKKHPLIIFLLLFASISIYATAASDPLINVRNYPLEYCFKQIQWYILAFLAIYCIAKINNQDIFKYAKWLFGICIIAVYLLALQHQITQSGSDLKLIPFSHNVNGATAWFEFPGIGTIQPSEFLKMTYLLMLANIVYRHHQKYPHAQLKSDLKLIGSILLLTIPTCLGILLQNDTGVMLIVLAGTIAVICVSGIQKYWFILALIILGIGGYFAYQYILSYLQNVDSLALSYRFGRILGWLDPETYYESYGYQLYNASLSMATAGLFGHGFQSIVMAFPEPQTDFIFAVLVSNAGLIAGAMLILMIIAFDLYLLKLVSQTKDQEHYLVVGLVGILFFQQFWNIAMILGLVPITGITLPLISYGGSSLMSYMMMFGLVYNLEKRFIKA